MKFVSWAMYVVAAVCGAFLVAYTFGGVGFLVTKMLAIQKIQINEVQLRSLGEYIAEKKNEGLEFFSLRDYDAIQVGDTYIDIIDMYWNAWNAVFRKDPRKINVSWYFGSGLRVFSGNRILLVDLKNVGVKGGDLVGRSVSFVKFRRDNDVFNGRRTEMRVVQTEQMNYKQYLRLTETLDTTKVSIVDIDGDNQSANGNYNVYFLEKI